MKACLILLLVSLVPFVAFSQPNGVYGDYVLKGIVENEQGERIPGLTLVFTNEVSQKGTAISDAFGRFEMALASGTYTVVSGDLDQNIFRAFLQINKAGLNPQDVVFVMNTATLCSGQESSAPMPTIVQSFTPPYPAVANAVRAMGRVRVNLEIDSSGKVTTSVAMMGHPLLRKAAEIAAGKFVFAVSDNPSPRRTTLDFIFAPSDEKADRSIARYDCKYRIVIPAQTIETN
jgi:hypothetical protein